MSPPRRHGPFFLVGTVCCPRASLSSLVPLSSRAIAGFAASSALSIPRPLQRRRPRLLPCTFQAQCPAPLPGNTAGSIFRLNSVSSFVRHVYRSRRPCRRQPRPLLRPFRSLRRTPVVFPVRELHRVAFRSRSLVASSDSLKRRSGFIPSLCRDPESFVVCSFLFSHFYARRRFLSHLTHLWCPGQQARECHEPSYLTATCHVTLLPDRHATNWRHGVFHQIARHPVEIQWFPGPRILPGTRMVGLWLST